MSENLSQKETAKRLGIVVRVLSRYTKSGRITRNPDKSYPWPNVQLEHQAIQRVATAARAAGHGNLGFQAERARLVKEQADKAETENLVRRGELVELADVAKLVRAPLEAVDRKLKSAKGTHAKAWAKRLRVSEAVAMELIEALVEDVRSDLRALAGRAE